MLFPIDYVRFLSFQSYIKCKHVDYMSSRTEPFYDIQLNVKGKKNSEYLFTVNYTMVHENRRICLPTLFSKPHNEISVLYKVTGITRLFYIGRKCSCSEST